MKTAAVALALCLWWGLNIVLSALNAMDRWLREPRMVCKWTYTHKKPIRHRGKPFGRVSHGICPACFRFALLEARSLGYNVTNEKKSK